MNVIRELWKDKPLFIAVVAGILIVVYILMKNSQNALQASMQSNATTPAAGPGYGPGTFVEYSYYNNQPVSNTPAPTSAPTVVTPVATVTTSSPIQPLPSTNPASGSPVPTTRSYTVVSGDTLSGIAARLGTTWQSLFAGNQSTIVNTSNAHGNPIPGGPQNNIFPGEMFTY